MGGGAQLEDNCVLYSKVQNLTDGEKEQARKNIGAADASGGGKVYRHCVKVDLVHTESGRDHYSTFAFDVFLSSANELTSGNIRNILSGMAVAPKSGKYMINDLPDTLQDIGYVIFSTSGTVSVFHYLVNTGVSLSNDSTRYFQSGSATMTVVDFVQEMP